MNIAKGKIEALTVKKWIQAEGIDLVRIADAQNLILAYPPRPATALMPSARSVIVMAVAHSLGAVVTATDLEPTEPLPALEAVYPEQARKYILDMAPEVRALYETDNGAFSS